MGPPSTQTRADIYVYRGETLHSCGVTLYVSILSYFYLETQHILVYNMLCCRHNKPWLLLCVCVFVCVFFTLLALESNTSVGVRGHTTGRILHRLETEQKYGTYTPCGSKLPPLGACVTYLVLNQSRLHTISEDIERYRKISRTRYCANAAGNNRYKPDGFQHPPTTHRRRVPCRVLADQAPPPPHRIPGKNSRGAVWRGGRGQKIKKRT